MGKKATKARKGFLTEDEQDAIRLGIKALKQKADDMGSALFAPKGPIMYCLYAADDLKRLLKRGK